MHSKVAAIYLIKMNIHVDEEENEQKDPRNLKA